MKTEAILALDLGTTGNRALVIDREHRILAQAYLEFTQYFPKAGWVEHDAEEIFSTTLRVAKEAMAQAGEVQIKAIGITNQRETVVFWDKKSGKPVHRAIVWQCRRTSEDCAMLKQEGVEDEVHRKTGLYLDPYFSATKIAWLLRQSEKWRRKAERGEIVCGTIDSWIIFRLTNGKVHTTDVSNASRTMLMNLHSGDWDPELLRLFKVPAAMLPSISKSSGVVGETDADILGSRIPIAGIIGDQQSAAFAQGCFNPGVVKNTYGTGLFLLRHSGGKPDFIPGMLSTVAWALDEKIEYAVEGSIFIGGAAIQWLRDQLKIVEHAEETEALARQLNGNDGVYFVPALTGLGAPYWDSQARGVIVGLTRGTSRAHLARAALEAIAYQTKDAVGAMFHGQADSLKKLRVDGGACRNNFLMQFQADILGVPVERPRVIETTALGAAGMAGLAVGLWASPDDFIRHSKTDHVFQPVMAQAERTSLYSDWQRAVERAKAWVK